MKLDPEAKAELQDGIALMVFAAVTWGLWAVVCYASGEWLSNGLYDVARLVFTEGSELRRRCGLAVFYVPAGVFWIGGYTLWRRWRISRGRRGMVDSDPSGRNPRHTP